MVGLGHVVKRGWVFAHLKSLKADIIGLEWTWLKGAQVFQAPFTHEGRGVAMLFFKNIQFCLKSLISDPHSSYIIVVGKINCIYIYTNADNPDFFISIQLDPCHML